MNCPHCKQNLSENHFDMHVQGCWRQERLRILKELQESLCFCGSRKTPRQTFCRKHYALLPANMRSALYSKFGEGYEQAYVAARKHFEPANER